MLRVSGDPIQAYLGSEEAELTQLSEAQVTAIREKLGLDKPVMVQYLIHVGNILRGDFGNSFIYQERPAAELLAERLPATTRLAAAALLVATLISLPGGVIAALYRNKLPDTLVNIYSVVGDAMPSFWLGIMLMLLFAVQLQWLPVSGSGTWKHLVLPAVTLGTSMAALLTRLMRGGLIEVLQLDYIRTAHSKGLAPRTVLFKHALRNAVLSYVTLLGLAVPGLLGGSVIIERIFAWPGVGLLFINALSGRDMAIIQAVVIFTSLLVVLANLLVDVLYTLIDPRIKYQ
jgi:peptide/nickel transport system permease protein